MLFSLNICKFGEIKILQKKLIPFNMELNQVQELETEVVSKRRWGSCRPCCCWPMPLRAANRDAAACMYNGASLHQPPTASTKCCSFLSSHQIMVPIQTRGNLGNLVQSKLTLSSHTVLSMWCKAIVKQKSLPTYTLKFPSTAPKNVFHWLFLHLLLNCVFKVTVRFYWIIYLDIYLLEYFICYK